MNNLCCLIAPDVTCYYCGVLWCRPCWSYTCVIKPPVFSICQEGNWARVAHNGHYTITVGTTPHSVKEVERHRINPNSLFKEN